MYLPPRTHPKGTDFLQFLLLGNPPFLRLLHSAAQCVTLYLSAGACPVKTEGRLKVARRVRVQVTVDPELWAWVTFEAARSGIPPATIMRGWITQAYKIARREKDELRAIGQAGSL